VPDEDMITAKEASSNNCYLPTTVVIKQAQGGPGWINQVTLNY